MKLQANESETLHFLAAQMAMLSSFFQVFIKVRQFQKEFLVSSNSPKKQTIEFVFTTGKNSFICFLGEFEDIKKCFRNYLTFSTWNFESYQYLTVKDGVSGVAVLPDENEW